MISQKSSHQLIHINHLLNTDFESTSKQLIIKYDVIETLFGLLNIAWTSQGVCHLSFSQGLTQFVRQLSRDWCFSKLEPTNLDNSIKQFIFGIFEGNQVSQKSHLKPPVTLPVFIKATKFQLTVWQNLLRVPYGHTCSYADLARFIGNPLAVRAVGKTLSQNRLAILIPCHRVIRTDSKLGGYRWGLSNKFKLIEWERNNTNQNLRNKSDSRK